MTYHHSRLGRVRRTQTAVRIISWLMLITGLLVLWTASCSEAAHADGVVTADGGQPTELCPFSPGWNLVVLNGTPDDLPSCVGVVWRYEAPDDRWFFWGRDNAPYWNDLVSFDITKGYWVWAQY